MSNDDIQRTLDRKADVLYTENELLNIKAHLLGLDHARKIVDEVEKELDLMKTNWECNPACVPDSCDKAKEMLFRIIECIDWLNKHRHV